MVNIWESLDILNLHLFYFFFYKVIYRLKRFHRQYHYSPKVSQPKYMTRKVILKIYVN